MNKLLLVSVGFLALGAATQATAADLPARTYQPAPVMASVYNWTGFYIGGNVGGVWGTGRVNDFATGAAITNTRANATGGGQIGYNYMFAGGFVLGLEGTFNWSGRNSGTTTVTLPGGTVLNGTGSGAQWLTTFAGRMGYAADRALFYVKGGGAWLNSSVTINNLTNGATYTSSNARTGFVVGGGIEYALTQNWTVKGEYDYVSANSWVTPVTPAGQFKLSGNIQMFTVGANYKF